MNMKLLFTTKARVLFFLLSAILLLATPVYAQRSVRKKPYTTTQLRGDNDLQQVQKLIGKELKGYVNIPLSDELKGYVNIQLSDYGIKEDYLLPIGLIERDVLGYYKLQDKYNSPLKMKMFKQSDEYKELVRKMERERDKLLADTFYIIEKVPKTNYDLRNNSFFFYVPQTNILYSTTHYIDYGYLGIVSPVLVNRGLQVKIFDENNALDIEDNYKDCRLVYVFTVNESLSEKTEKTGLGDSHLICDMQRLYLVNINKQKVYYDVETGLALKKYVQYDKDIFTRYKIIEGYVMPSNYYLKSGEQYIEIQQDELDGYLYEESDGQYYVFGTDDKKYLLGFKPEIAEIMEKDEAYFKKCDKVRKDYMAHPKRYRDVTIIDEVTNESTGSYIDRNGYEWVLESEMHGFYLLEREKVYVLRDELRFIQKK